ncbi:hypothetical protein [Chishuiella sp.]|uniref:hypothetical protein n=1 Tax=Chishuiella sp. TaxID=1969467 RepID=UPI0028A86630|nr:hypothetical protein [Chishuiella sp.]
MNLKQKFYLLVHPNNNIEDDKYLIDYIISDKVFKIFTILWILHIVFLYNQRLSFSEKDIFIPLLDFQKIFLPTYPSFLYFYSITIIGITSAIWSIQKSTILPRIILLFCVLWLNAFKWSFGSISHSGHLLILTHFFSLFLVFKSNYNIRSFVCQIKYFQFGILLTYTIAGLWKLLFLIKDSFFPKKQYTTWLDPEAVKTNAIINLLDKDYIANGWMEKMYNIPIIWQIAVLGVFFIQLISIIGVINKKCSYFIALGLISFHLYNQYFTLTYFYPAIFTLLIIFFPYHLFIKNDFIKNFK